MAESEGKIKSLLIKAKVESEKVGLKLISLCHLVPSLHGKTDGETMETVRDFIFLGSKITADGDGKHEIKRFLPLGRKVLTNLDSILKSRDITFKQRYIWSKLWFFQQSCTDVRAKQ